jgi:4-hydroxy-3-methylbut-2-en-1-yl diphosphate synthase IspG/GcpE
MHRSAAARHFIQSMATMPTTDVQRTVDEISAWRTPRRHRAVSVPDIESVRATGKRSSADPGAAVADITSTTGWRSKSRDRHR